MNLATRKYNFIQELSAIDEIFPEMTEILIKANEKDWFTDLNSDEKLEIEIGLKQAENDEFISHETVMNRFSKWR
ncbi:hypothetical protein ACNQGB_19095 [Flavobacterium sp. XS1P32]|uniref:hypothetical protein n=1 Tax=unclassified Flavobacterium TaxID=196869 RepID=UPI003AB0D337